MQTLILSCNTGAGHNSCAQAVQEAYHSRGEICNITDSLQFISEKASTFISNWHTRIYRHAPRLFDAGYQRAESHEDIFCEGTPIYKLLSSGAERMYQYIRSAGYDNIISASTRINRTAAAYPQTGAVQCTKQLRREYRHISMM